ncbi:MAG: cellulosomal protein [bacterium]|nr:cellulosomal protein [bacterium]
MKKTTLFTLLISIIFLFFITACGSSDSGSPGDAGSAALIINEIVAKDADGGYDWIELYSSGSAAVDLSAYTLRDSANDPASFSDATLAPGEYLIVYASDDDPGDNSAYVSFKLGSHDSVTLLQNGESVDSFDWDDGDAPEGSSYGRLPENSENMGELYPTPGAANAVAAEMFPSDEVIEVRLELSNADWQDIRANPLDEEFHPGTIVYNGITVNNVAIRTKGNSSLRSVAEDPDSDRYSLKIDFNYYTDGQDLMGYQKIVLNNNYMDPSYLRETIAYNLMREMGLPAPQITFANLYINDELFGLYTAVEAIDDEFIKANFENSDGDLYKPDGLGCDLLYETGNDNYYSGLWDSWIELNEDTTDHGAMLNLVYEFNYGSSYESVLDIDSFLRYLAVSTVLVNLDSYQGSSGHNYYIYEPEDGAFHILPWDLNMAFGTFSSGCSRDELIAFKIDEPTGCDLCDRPLIEKVLQNATYLAAYHGYIEDLVDGSFSPAAMKETIESFADLIREHVNADPTKFYSFAEFEQSLSEDVGSIIGLEAFVDERSANLSAQLSGSASSSGDGSGNCNCSSGGPGPPR